MPPDPSCKRVTGEKNGTQMLLPVFLFVCLFVFVCLSFLGLAISK